MPSQSMSLGGRRPFGYDPPDVQLVEDDDGHRRPEPPCDIDASEIDKLRYDAAFTKACCGVDCRIGQLNGLGTYDFAVYDLHGDWVSSGNCGSYWETKAFLGGIEIGAFAGAGANTGQRHG